MLIKPVDESMVMPSGTVVPSNKIKSCGLQNENTQFLKSMRTSCCKGREWEEGMWGRGGVGGEEGQVGDAFGNNTKMATCLGGK